MRIKYNLLVLMVNIIFSLVNGQNIQTSPHNLSVFGPGSVRASTETEICIFCHTPHNSSSRQPLWNKKDPTGSYTLYSSSTQQSTSLSPDGGSLLCLSCHDGTIALGEVLSRTEVISFRGEITVLPPGETDLTEFLADDHPISIVYDDALVAADVELVDPSLLTGLVQLRDSKVQCTSCHNPHDNILGNFLVESNQYSLLCEYCHQKTGWSTASHKYSGATVPDTIAHTGFSSVAENACENCHRPHGAGNQKRLTKYFLEEDNCLNCHDGNVATTDIQTDINLSSHHDVTSLSNIHDPLETLPVQNRHAECVDCHNPHVANSSVASAPNANGFIQGVSGINSDGNPVLSIQYEYELCYKCHADSPGKPSFAIERQYPQNNVRFQFDPGSISFHPVEAAGKNINVPSLIPGYTVASIIYCTDCHASADAVPSAAAGPHGSSNFPLLKYNYETASYTTESYSAYELCYQCHDYDKIIHDLSNFGVSIHNTHIVAAQTPCSVCHDAHGISNSQGSSANNSHLINFDTNVVSFSSGATSLLEFTDNGDFAGSCYLTCHGRNHRGKSYSN